MLSTVNLTTANPLSLNSDWKNKSGLLSLGDTNDVYSLAVSKASSLNLNLSTIGAGNLFAIVQDSNGNNKIEDSEILFQSSQTSVIQNVQLAAGNYSIVADLTTLTGGATSVMYQFGLTYSGVDEKWVVEATGDLNGDGTTDIMWRHRDSSSVGFWEMDDQGNILRAATLTLTVPSDWKVIGMGDMDGDGKSDLFWRDLISGEIQVWLMNGKQVQSFFSLGSLRIDQGWQIEGLGDIDANGTSDILWRNKVSGQVAFWTMNKEGKLLDGRLYGDILSDPNWQVVG